ncbi:RRM domain-containing protein [Pycnococcus provasolii]
MRRFYVAGLAHDASSEEVARMLAPMGNVLAVDMPLPKTFRPFGKHLSLATNLATSTEDTCRGFAFVDVEVKDERAVRRVTAAFEGSKARGGGKLRIRDAKPAFDLGEYKRKRAEEEIACEKASDVHQREKTSVVEPGAHFARTVRTLTFTPDANRVVTSATKAKAKAKELPVEAPTKTRKMDKRDSATLVGRQTNYDDDDEGGGGGGGGGGLRGGSCENAFLAYKLSRRARAEGGGECCASRGSRGSARCSGGVTETRGDGGGGGGGWIR